jgi:hypothetical protein
MDKLTDEAVIARLPKCKLFSVKLWPKRSNSALSFWHGRGANFYHFSLGRLHVTWRRPWLPHSAKALYPNLFTAAAQGRPNERA